MDEVKFKRVMSISASRILNIARFTEDGDITQDDFFKIMFILASLEEAQWNKEKLKIKAKSYLESLSGTAEEEIEKAILECQDMYINYWDLIEKQNKYRGKGKGKGKGKEDDGTPAKVEPVPEKKKPNGDVDSDFWWDAFSGDIAIKQDAANEVVSAGLKVEDVAGYLEANRNTFDLPFNPYSIEDVIEMYKEHQKKMKRQYPAAPSRGK